MSIGDSQNLEEDLITLRKHVVITGHQMNWDGTRIIDGKVKWHSCKVKEALHIEAAKPALNRDRGVKVSASWLRLVHKESRLRSE